MNCTRKNNIFLQSRKSTSYVKEKVNDVTADHSNPPTPQERREANEFRAKHPPLGWYNQQLYQVSGLSCKVEARAMIKALAASEYEATRGATAVCLLTRDHRVSSDLLDEFYNPSVVRQCQTFLATLSCGKVALGSARRWSTRRRKVRRMCRTAVKFSSSTARYPMTGKRKYRRFIPPQTTELPRNISWSRQALRGILTSRIKGKQGKPVPMEVGAVLAEVSASKDARGDGD